VDAVAGIYRDIWESVFGLAGWREVVAALKPINNVDSKAHQATIECIALFSVHRGRVRVRKKKVMKAKGRGTKVEDEW